MPRIFVCGTLHRQPGRLVNAAYAFCFEHAPDQIYWGRGWANEPVSVVREAGERILDAASECDPIPEIELITSATDLASRVDYAINRDAKRQEGYSVKPREQDGAWLRFAQLYRLCEVKIGDPKLHDNTYLFGRMRSAAKRHMNRTDLEDIKDSLFQQNDGNDLEAAFQA